MKKILVVDDEKEIRELLTEKLRKNDFDAVSAANGHEALMRAKDDLPDLILLDVAMPGLDGYETCQRLRKDEKTKLIPVLFLTGKELDSKSITKRLKELDAAGYIVKPSSFSDLLEKIKEVIG